MRNYANMRPIDVNVIFRSGRTISCTVGYFPSVGRVGVRVRVRFTDKVRVRDGKA